MSIANYIRDDLAVRLRSGQELPAPLTIDSLAEMYQVSFTPVRTAIAELIDNGLLARTSSRRLIVNPQLPVDGTAGVAIVRPEPPRDPYQEVVGDLVRASLQGKAIYLREEVTADKFDVSRSVIRNIFHRLAGEGILDHIPRRGWRLRAFSQFDLKSYIEMREAIEVKALNLAFPKMETQQLQKMLEANLYPQAPGDSPRIDESLHGYLIGLSGNTYFKDFFDKQGRYYGLLFRWEDSDRGAAVETVRQHREILTHLINRDLKASQEALSYHILDNHPILGRAALPGDEGRDGILSTGAHP